MTVKHAVLGLLIEQPGYPYDVALRMRRRFGPWQAAPASVGSAFDALIKAKRIRPQPDSRWYEATAEGRAFFEAWMREGLSAEAPPLRSSLLMKLGFPVEDDELLVQLHRDAREQEQWCVDRINELASPGDTSALLERHKDVTIVSPLLVREAEIAYLQATVDYLGVVVRELRRVYERRTGHRLGA